MEKKLLEAIEKELRELEVYVTCPRCGKRQLVKIEDIQNFCIGDSTMYTEGGDRPKAQCKNCQENGGTTILFMSEDFYRELTKALIRAFRELPPKYIPASFNEYTFCKAE